MAGHGASQIISIEPGVVNRLEGRAELPGDDLVHVDELGVGVPEYLRANGVDLLVLEDQAQVGRLGEPR